MKMANDAKRLENERFTVKYDVHFDKKRFQREVSDKIKTKLEAHEQAVERRREKLQLILCCLFQIKLSTISGYAKCWT